RPANLHFRGPLFQVQSGVLSSIELTFLCLCLFIFCLLVCSVCTFFAVLGRYIPGIVISYILGESSKICSTKGQLDSTVCKEMSVSDTEVSDVTWTDNGTFNLSEGHTPQTENSEDFDREEPFIGGLPEFPSLDNGVTTNGDDDDDLSLGLASPPTRLQDPIKSKHEPQDQSTNALDLVNQMAGEVITAAVTAAIQERIEAAVSFMTPTEDPKRAGLTESSRLLELTEESDSEVEDFELLDQSELEQLEGELVYWPQSTNRSHDVTFCTDRRWS
uniref:Reticulophagy regulator 1 n=1 Tax=Neolamprologus brichardi TaxID=32507 RepID=A0A3Q4G3W2_NEOBR